MRILTAALILVLVPATLTSAQRPEDMEPGTWLEVPNTLLVDVVADPEEFPGIRGTTGPRAIVGAWNGGAFDTRRERLVITGGGHSDYYGNELYGFDVNTLRWERLTDPTPNPPGGVDIQPDGTPQARHTYDGLAYMTHLDGFWVFAGSGSTIGGAGFPPTTNVWTYDFTAEAWSYVATPPPEGPPAGEGSSAVYDPETGLVWYGEGRNSNPSDGWGLWSWNPDDATWTHHDNSTVFSSASATIDTTRGLAFFLGRGQFQVVDVRSATPAPEGWDAPSALIDSRAPGIDYDPVTDRVVAWAGGPVYSLDPESREWEMIDAPGAPTPNGTGTFGRFAYAASVNAFVSVNQADENVFFFKNGAGAGTGIVDAGPVVRVDSGTGGTDAGPRSDAGSPPLGDGGTMDDGPMTGSCSCRVGAAPTPGLLPLAGLVVAAAVVRRRT